MPLFVWRARYNNALFVNYTNAACLLFFAAVYGYFSFFMHWIELVKQRLGRVIFV